MSSELAAAQASLRDGNLAAAIECCDRARKLDGGDTAALHVTLGTIYLQLAAQAFGNALQLDPGNAAASEASAALQRISSRSKPSITSSSTSTATDDDRNPLSSPEAVTAQLQADDLSLPPFMHARRHGCLRLAFDAAALQEYEADAAAYDQIFSWSSAAVAPMLEAVPQCPIWLHGVAGCWRYGHALKLREHGVDLGDVERGLAWHGNMHYEGFGDQEQSIFLINLDQAILRHPTVLVHELTHHFHLSIGPERLPCLTYAYNRTVAALPAIRTHFSAEVNRNAGQFDHTFVNELEFFAYLHEAYHCCGSDRLPSSARGVCFEAPAFPRTRAQLEALDAKLELGICAAIDEALAHRSRPPVGQASGGARTDQPSSSVVASPEQQAAAASALRQQFDAMMATNPHSDPTAAAAALLESLAIAPKARRSSS